MHKSDNERHRQQTQKHPISSKVHCSLPFIPWRNKPSDRGRHFSQCRSTPHSAYYKLLENPKMQPRLRHPGRGSNPASLSDPSLFHLNFIRSLGNGCPHASLSLDAMKSQPALATRAHPPSTGQGLRVGVRLRDQQFQNRSLSVSDKRQSHL